jgi:hypothetical protein
MVLVEQCSRKDGGGEQVSEDGSFEITIADRMPSEHSSVEKIPRFESCKCWQLLP